MMLVSVFVSVDVCKRDFSRLKRASSMDVHNSSAQSSAALHCEKAGYIAFGALGCTAQWPLIFIYI